MGPVRLIWKRSGLQRGQDNGGGGQRGGRRVHITIRSQEAEGAPSLRGLHRRELPWLPGWPQISAGRLPLTWVKIQVILGFSPVL